MVTTQSPQECTNNCKAVGLAQAEMSDEMVFAKWQLKNFEYDAEIFRKYGRNADDIDLFKENILSKYIFFHVCKTGKSVEWRQIEFYVNQFIDGIVGTPLDEDLGNPFLLINSQIEFYAQSEIDADIFPCPEYLCEEYHAVVDVICDWEAINI